MATIINQQHFRLFCLSLSGENLRTMKRGYPFLFRMESVQGQSYSFVFTPESTGNSRPVTPQAIDNYLRAYHTTDGSYTTTDYDTSFRHLSYMLTLFKLFADHLPANPGEDPCFHDQSQSK